MKIKLERYQARIIVSGSGRRACPRSSNAKRETNKERGQARLSYPEISCLDRLLPDRTALIDHNKHLCASE